MIFNCTFSCQDFFKHWNSIENACQSSAIRFALLAYEARGAEHLITYMSSECAYTLLLIDSVHAEIFWIQTAGFNAVGAYLHLPVEVES